MKRYVRPMMESEEFLTNEYVSSCWYGACNISGDVYVDNNGNDKYDSGIDTFLYTNEACNHEFEITGESSTKPGVNTFVVGEQWHLPGYWDKTPLFGIPYYHVTGIPERKNTVTPVYHFDKVHVSTIDNIKPNTEKPNHS